VWVQEGTKSAEGYVHRLQSVIGSYDFLIRKEKIAFPNNAREDLTGNGKMAVTLIRL